MGFVKQRFLKTHHQRTLKVKAELKGLAVIISKNSFMMTHDICSFSLGSLLFGLSSFLNYNRLISLRLSDLPFLAEEEE